MTFWLLVCALALGAAIFAAWPLLRQKISGVATDPLADADAMVRALYEDRLSELGSEAQAGHLDDATRVEVEAELGANLLADYQREDGSATAASESLNGRPALLTGWLVAALLPLAGLAVYFSVGEPTASDIAGASVVLQLDPVAERPQLEDWRDRLARRVAREPEDTRSWYLLGIARLQLAEYPAAAEALSRAQALDGPVRGDPDPNIDLYWLQARYLAAGGELDGQSGAIAQRLLSGQPNHPVVLEILAIDAYRKEDFRTAVTYLNRALMNDLGDARSLALLSGLAQARGQLGDLVPSVEVDITAADSVPPGSTLFVIARPPGGGIPYAVVRRPAALLPVSVTLDDTVSMNPAVQLSQAGPVEVVVRLSRSGAAAVGADDWEWRSETLDLAEQQAPLKLSARLEPPVSEPAQAQIRQPQDKQAQGKQESFLPSVKVDISAAEPVPSGSTLFVIARPPGGGMPYAVVRRQGEQLPLTVMLDDSVSMNPAVRLSQAGPVEVVVRLSRTGATAAGPGDWEWRSETLALAEQRAPLTLSARLEPPPR